VKQGEETALFVTQIESGSILHLLKQHKHYYEGMVWVLWNGVECTGRESRTCCWEVIIL